MDQKETSSGWEADVVCEHCGWLITIKHPSELRVSRSYSAKCPQCNAFSLVPQVLLGPTVRKNFPLKS